jgi:hypothetical protein
MVAVASKEGSYSLIAFKSPYFQEEPLVAPVIPPPFPLFYLHENKGEKGRRYLKLLRALSEIRFGFRISSRLFKCIPNELLAWIIPL